MPTKVMHLPMPTSKNQWQRMHWSERSCIKKDWGLIIWAEVNVQPRMPRPLEQVTCSIYVAWDKKGPLPDPHNLEMSIECVADGLVEAGIIRDDAGDRFVRKGVFLRRVLPGETGRSVVVLRYSEGVID